MLAVTVLCGVTIFPFFPAGIKLHGRCHFLSIHGIDNNGSTGIRTIV
jgi:hypothetical protein